MAVIEAEGKKIERLTAKFVKQHNEDLPKKIGVFCKQAFHMLGIFDAIIDADPTGEVPEDYSKWDADKINKEMFTAYAKLKPKREKLPSRIAKINAGMKTYSDECDKVSQWRNE